MSLDWDVTKVHNYQEIKTDEEWPITYGLIFLTMSIGIREITEENCREVLTRIRCIEKVYGPTFQKPGQDGGPPEPRPVTIEDIKRRIGLKTNVNLMTKLQFLKNISSVMYDNIMQVVEYEERKAA